MGHSSDKGWGTAVVPRSVQVLTAVVRSVQLALQGFWEMLFGFCFLVKPSSCWGWVMATSSATLGILLYSLKGPSSSHRSSQMPWHSLGGRHIFDFHELILGRLLDSFGVRETEFHPSWAWRREERKKFSWVSNSRWSKQLCPCHKASTQTLKDRDSRFWTYKSGWNGSSNGSKEMQCPFSYTLFSRCPQVPIDLYASVSSHVLLRKVVMGKQARKCASSVQSNSWILERT